KAAAFINGSLNNDRINSNFNNAKKLMLRIPKRTKPNIRTQKYLFKSTSDLALNKIGKMCEQTLDKFKPINKYNSKSDTNLDGILAKKTNKNVYQSDITTRSEHFNNRKSLFLIKDLEDNAKINNNVMIEA